MRRVMMIVAVLAAMTGANAQQEGKSMEKMMGIRFEPQEWMELELDWSEYVWNERENACTPVVDEWGNKLLINVPTRVLVDSRSLHEVALAIPVSIFSKISDNRRYKYYDSIYFLRLYIRKVGEKEVFYESFIDKIEKIELPVNITDKHPEPKPVDPIEEARVKARRQNAMAMTDEELDKERVPLAVTRMTFNACDYVSVPLQPGKYEVYCTFRGLESEHKVVEIVFE